MFPVYTPVQVINPTHAKHGQAGTAQGTPSSEISDQVRTDHKAFDGSDAPLAPADEVCYVQFDLDPPNTLTAVAHADLRGL